MKVMSRMSKSYRLKARAKSAWAERSSYFMIAPFMVAFFIFTVIPVVAAIVLSFTDFNMLQTPNFVGFDNYKTLFLNDDIFIIAVRLSGKAPAFRPNYHSSVKNPSSSIETPGDTLRICASTLSFCDPSRVLTPRYCSMGMNCSDRIDASPQFSVIFRTPVSLAPALKK